MLLSRAMLFPIESSDPTVAAPDRDEPQYLRLDAAATNGGAAVAALPDATLIHGRASEALNLLPARSVRTVVTSPPYWSLRDYDTGRFGRDDTLRDYVASIVADFQKLRRVLTDDGTVWLNVGDVYTSGNRAYRAPDRKNRARDDGSAPNSERAQVEGSDRVAVALGLRASGRWLVGPVRGHLAQAERAP